MGAIINPLSTEAAAEEEKDEEEEEDPASYYNIYLSLSCSIFRQTFGAEKRSRVGWGCGGVESCSSVLNWEVFGIVQEPNSSPQWKYFPVNPS